MDCGTNRTKMKLYLADFGEGANGGRYALFKAHDISSAVLDVDAIGSPKRIARLKMPVEHDDFFYIEMNEPENPYAGPRFNELNWKSFEHD